MTSWGRKDAIGKENALKLMSRLVLDEDKCKLAIHKDPPQLWPCSLVTTSTEDYEGGEFVNVDGLFGVDYREGDIAISMATDVMHTVRGLKTPNNFKRTKDSYLARFSAIFHGPKLKISTNELCSLADLEKEKAEEKELNELLLLALDSTGDRYTRGNKKAMAKKFREEK